MPAGAYDNGMVQVMNSGLPPGYPGHQMQRVMSQPMEMKPNVVKLQPEEPRVTRNERDGCLLPIFKLEHNAKVTNHDFTLSEEVMQLLMQE